MPLVVNTDSPAAKVEFTYDVTFYGKSDTDQLSTRVVAVSSEAAVTVAAEKFDKTQLASHNWAVKIRLVDLDEEEAERQANSDLYAQHDAAVKIFEGNGFVKDPESKLPFHHFPDSNFYAFVDTHHAPEGGRFAGIYLHELGPRDQDLMRPIVSIPWYGDGAWEELQYELLDSAFKAIFGPKSQGFTQEVDL